MNETPKPTVREIRTHIVNPANDKLKLTVIDPPGPGGGHHAYMISGVEFERNPSAGIAKEAILEGNDLYYPMLFQNGPIPENGNNGLTNEILLAMVLDRLQCFQAGPYSSRENSIAITHLETAMLWMQKRTMDRMDRGVEGKLAK